MTIIIALKDKNKTFLASDSQVTKGQLKSEKNKIFSKKLNTIDNKEQIINTENIYFASTGDSVNSLWLKHGFDIPNKKENQTNIEYLVKTFCKELKEEIEETGLVKENNKKINTSVWFIVVLGKEIYEITNHCGVFTPVEDYCCLGSGEEVALGSLYTSEDVDDMTPKCRIRVAINACDYHTIYCNNRINIIECD